MSSQSKYYNTGGGELFITPIVDGVLGTEKAFGQTEDIGFSVTTEEITHDNTEGAVVVEDLKILTKVTGSLNINTVEISPDMLTNAFLGTNLTTSKTAGVATAYNVTITTLDTPYYIGAKLLSNVIVKSEDDVDTYVLGTDYTLDTETGMITAIGGGLIHAADVLHVTADNSAYDDIRIEAFTQSKIEAQLRFVSHASNGISYVYTFYRVSLLASGDYSLKSATELAKLAFTGTMLADETKIGTDVSNLFIIEGVELTS